MKYAESFGAKGYRVGAADELLPILEQAIADNTVVVIDCPGRLFGKHEADRAAEEDGVSGVAGADGMGDDGHGHNESSLLR